MLSAARSALPRPALSSLPRLLPGESPGEQEHEEGEHCIPEAGEDLVDEREVPAEVIPKDRDTRGPDGDGRHVEGEEPRVGHPGRPGGDGDESSGGGGIPADGYGLAAMAAEVVPRLLHHPGQPGAEEGQT